MVKFMGTRKTTPFYSASPSLYVTLVALFALVLGRPDLPLSLLVLLSLPAGTLLIASLRPAAISRRRPLARGVLAAFFVGPMALCMAHWQHEEHREFREWLGEEQRTAEVSLLITQGPLLQERGYRYSALVLSIDTFEEERNLEKPKIQFFLGTEDLDPCSPLPLPGEEVRIYGQLSRFAPQEVSFRPSRRQIMEGRGYQGSLFAREAPAMKGPSGGPSLQLKRRLSRHRILLERQLALSLEGDGLALAMAMLTGSRGLLRPEFRAPFDITSTGHILAISGLHFAVIGGLLSLLLTLFFNRFPQLYCYVPRPYLVGVLTLIGLGVYVLAIGAPISAQRAFAMLAMVVTCFLFLPWRSQPIGTLCVVAAALLLFQPRLLLELGYQLSISATGGICIFLRFRPLSLRVPRVLATKEKGTQKWKRRLGTFLGVSLSASIATWPALWLATGEISLLTLPANLVVVPLVSVFIFPVLVAGAIAALVPLPGALRLSEILLWSSTEVLLISGRMLDTIAYHDFASLRLGTPSELELTVFTAAVLAALLVGLRPRILLFLTPLTVALLVLCATLQPSFDGLELHFIPVGQGDATLVRFSDGTTFLIDSGGSPRGADPGLMKVAPYLRHLGVRHLDGVLITHAHYDHYGGIPALLRPFQPKKLYYDPVEQNEGYNNLLEEVRSQGVELVPVAHRAVFAGPDVSLQILRPQLTTAQVNDRSLTVSLTYSGVGVVLPGDLEIAGEAWLRETLTGPRAIMKVGHHGSRTSSQQETLAHFQPRIGVISTGRFNRFGHPHEEVLERYDTIGTDLFRLDQNGAIRIRIHRDGRVVVRRTNQSSPPR